METLFLSLQNARVFFEQAFQKKNLRGKTSHKYFPKYFVMDLRKRQFRGIPYTSSKCDILLSI